MRELNKVLALRWIAPFALGLLITLLCAWGAAHTISASHTPPLSATTDSLDSQVRQARQTTNQSLYDVRVNQGTLNDQHEPTLAVDPTNPNNIIAAAKDWRTGPKQVWHYRSTDGGRTWADGYLGSLPTELPNQSDPVVTFDADGNAYLAIIGYNQNDFSVGGIFVAKSTDKGATWQKPVLVTAHSDQVFNDKEWIAVDRSGNRATRGNIYVSWTLFTSTGRNRERAEIVVSRSTDGGRTFSERKVVSLPEQDLVQGSFPAVGPNGEVYVLYYTDKVAGGTVRDSLYISKSTDGGQTFATARKVADVKFPPSPLPGSRFRIFILPALVVDPRNGTLYATWNDYASGDTDVMLASSADGGLTWKAPVRVNDNPTAPRTDQFFPTAVVGSDGTLHLMWLDRRDDPQNKLYVPYYARSTDNGATFSKNFPISGVQSNPDTGFEGVLIGDYNAIDVAADGKWVYNVWVDTRNGDQDVYFSAFDALSTQGVPAAATPLPRATPVAMPSPQPLTGFSDDAFRNRWVRSDRPVLVGAVQRPWVWGPVAFGAAYEPYRQGSNGIREVQYFDKARMEINNPGGDRSAPGFVTNGLLVVELISGRVQVGNNEYEAPRPPSQVPVAGDLNSPDALTYASLASVASLNNDKRALDRTGQTVTAVLNKAGQVRDDPSRGSSQVRAARYEPTLGHNIPDVFWTFLNASGPVYNSRFERLEEGRILDWVADVGLPITEPYWTNVRINGAQRWVLVQAFQRRVLTYVADNPPGWQVEMGNVGRHYHDWRYGLQRGARSR